MARDDARSSSELMLLADDPERTTAIACDLARLLGCGDLLGLTGELGAGKTHFVRGLVAGLGLDPQQVASPTFVLLHEYPPPAPATSTDPATATPATNADAEAATSADAQGPGAPARVLHLDVYRLGEAEELQTLGWGEAGEALREEGVVVVEWADQVREAMGADWLEVALEHAEAGGRVVTLIGHGAWAGRMGAVREALAGR